MGSFCFSGRRSRRVGTSYEPLKKLHWQLRSFANQQKSPLNLPRCYSQNFHGWKRQVKFETWRVPIDIGFRGNATDSLCEVLEVKVRCGFWTTVVIPLPSYS